MQTREWLLTAAVIVIPLIIAVTVTMWSLDQVRYRPKKRRPTASAGRKAGTVANGSDQSQEPREIAASGREG